MDFRYEDDPVSFVLLWTIAILLTCLYPVRMGVRLAQWHRALFNEEPLWAHPTWILLDITLIPAGILIMVLGFIHLLRTGNGREASASIAMFVLALIVYLNMRPSHNGANGNWDDGSSNGWTPEKYREFWEEQDESDFTSGLPPYERK